MSDTHSEQNDSRRAAPAGGAADESTGRRILIAGVGGRAPLGVPLLAALVAVPVTAIFVALATWWAVDHIEDQLVDEARADLVAQGIDAEGLRIDFDYRDGDAWAVLPAGLDAQDAERGVDHRLLDDFDLHVTSRSSVDDDALDDDALDDDALDDGADATTDGNAIAVTGSTVVDLTVDDDVRLRGEVLSDAQRRTLVDAATDAFGADRVIDELRVLDADEAVEGADARVDALAAVIAALADTDEASASLTDTDLTVRAAGDQSLSDTLNGAVADASLLERDIVVTAPPGPAADPAPEPPAADDTVDEESIDALQVELDALAAEIRENVTFATGSDVLDGGATGTLDEVVAAMERHPGPSVEISGHTDNTGDPDANRALSQARAAAVVAYLVEQGIDAERLSARGAGADEPVADNDTPEGRAQNRRVELTAGDSFTVPPA